MQRRHDAENGVLSVNVGICSLAQNELNHHLLCSKCGVECPRSMVARVPKMPALLVAVLLISCSTKIEYPVEWNSLMRNE